MDCQVHPTFFQGLPEKKLHYVLISHFHEDHIGEPVISSKISENGAYKLSGISEVAELVTCGKLVDRGWPDYNWPLPLKSETGSNYVRFVKSQVEKGKLQAEQFHVGMNNQFTLMNNPGKYPDFEIRNIAANGHIWTGTGTTERNHFPITEEGPAKNIPGENGCSVAFRLSYGKFDYFSGGDIYSVTSDLWQDVETPAGLVTGPVDVCKANHHANFDTMGKTFLQALRPRVIIIQTWIAQQPDMSVLRRMLSESTYPGPRDIFTTNLREETKIVVGWAADKLKNQQGHTVVRVNPGGASYMVYILDDSEENFRIKAKFGPYDCN